MNSGNHQQGREYKQAVGTKQSDVLHSLPRVIITINSLRERNEKRRALYELPVKIYGQTIFIDII